MVFWNRLHPSTLASLVQEENLLERDYRIKVALGFPDHVFERGAKLLDQASSGAL
jgi:hypothetical protein